MEEQQQQQQQQQRGGSTTTNNINDNRFLQKKPQPAGRDTITPPRTTLEVTK